MSYFRCEISSGDWAAISEPGTKEHLLTSLHTQLVWSARRGEILSDGGRWLPTVTSISCLRWLVSRGVSSPPRLPVLVTGGVQRVLPCGISKPQCPHPNTLPGQPVPPTQPEWCNHSSVSETLQASINKCGVSPAAAHSPGKATAAKALTWKFTQTLSGFAIKQQNVTLLLLSLHFTSL